MTAGTWIASPRISSRRKANRTGHSLTATIRNMRRISANAWVKRERSRSESAISRSADKPRQPRFTASKVLPPLRTFGGLMSYTSDSPAKTGKGTKMGNTADYKLLRNSSVGAELHEDEARTLAEKIGVRQLKDGELLISEGASDETLFILTSVR